MASASPSTMAVFPTPGSPTSTGLFFRRRQSTWIIRSTSAARPMSGSISPFAARSTRFTVYARNGSFAGRSARPPVPSSPSSGSSGEEPSSPSFVAPCETNWRMSIRRIPCASRRWTACEHVARVQLGPAAPLDVPGGPLEDPLERGGLLRIALELERLDGPVEVLLDLLAQTLEVGAAGEEDLLRDPVVRQGEEEVLEGDVLVVAAARVRQGRLEGLLQLFRNRDHGYSGSIVMRSGYSRSRARAVALAAFVSAISHG